MKRFLALAAVAVLLLTFIPSASLAKNDAISFNADGSFKLLVFADVQDTQLTSMFVIEAMERVLDAEKPDMVLFLGDQLEGWNPIMFIFADKAKSTRTAIDNILKPVVSRGIPFAVTFGNHDSEAILSRDEQLEIYKSYSGCLSYDADESLPGCGTCNIPIMSSDGTRMALNLYIVDSLDYTDDGGYGVVSEEQIDWCTAKSAELTAANGGAPVPSMVFQHIIVPEIYGILPEVAQGSANSFKGKASGKGRTFSNDSSLFESGELLETPSPGNYSTGQFAGWVAQGDVMAAVFGHDHTNTFIIEHEGIKLISAPASTYTAYGDNSARGVRVLEFNEADVSAYEARLVCYEDTYAGGFFRDIWRYITSTTAGGALYSGLKMFVIPGIVIIVFAITIPVGIHRKNKKKRAKTGEEA